MPGDTQWDDKALSTRIAAAIKGQHKVPNRLIGISSSASPRRRLPPNLSPLNWRGWWMGQGALGDMGAHLIDFPTWGLNLPLPTVVERSTPFNGAWYPIATTTYYEFITGKGPVTMRWYDGGLMPGSRGTGRREAEPRRRHPLRRQEGQAAARRPDAAPAARLETQLVRRAEGKAAACRTRITR